MPQRLTALLYSILITLFATGTTVGEDAKDVTVATNQESPVETLCQKLDTTIKAALSSCAKDTTAADSIAIALLDTLNVLADEVYDLYNSDTSLHGEKKSGITSAFKERLEQCAIISVVADSVRIFKGSPALVYEKCKPYLSEAGKAFFTTRMRDQLQPCLWDDMLYYLPSDTIFQRVLMWEAFVSQYKGTYVSSIGETYWERYIGAYFHKYHEFKEMEMARDKVPEKRTGKLLAKYLECYKRSHPGFIGFENFLIKNGIPVFFYATDPAADIHILTLGMHHGSEDRDEDKTRDWLALQCLEGECKLKKVTPTFRKVYDPLNDEVLNDSTGIYVTVPLKNVVILLSGKGIQPGKVFSCFNQTPVLPSKDSFATFKMGITTYQLRSRVSYRIERIFMGYNGKIKYLYPPYRETETNAELMWVGDLDHDNKPDVLLNASDHYNVWDYRLYLSGKAAPGKLLRWEVQCLEWGD